MNTPMFFPQENTYAPFIRVLMAITARVTHSSSSICMDARVLRRGETKNRQISGSLVMAGVVRMGMRSK